MAKLTPKQRSELPARDFGLPERQAPRRHGSRRGTTPFRTRAMQSAPSASRVCSARPETSPKTSSTALIARLTRSWMQNRKRSDQLLPTDRPLMLAGHQFMRSVLSRQAPRPPTRRGPRARSARTRRVSARSGKGQPISDDPTLGLPLSLP